MASDTSVVEGEAQRAGPPVLSILVSVALLIAALAQVAAWTGGYAGTSDIEFVPVTGVLAVVMASGALLRSRTARAIVIGAGIGGFCAVASWPPWAMLDADHPVPAWIGFFILVLMGALIAAGWRENRVSTGRELFWQLVVGGGIGWAAVYAVLVVILVWVVMSAPMSL
jgi:hypothetical protein